MAQWRGKHRTIFAAAAADGGAAAVLDRASRALGEALIILERVFDAERYTLGGGLANAAFAASIQAKAAGLGFAGYLRLHPWGERAALAGAALWALRN